MNNEIWKDVIGFEGLYQISNLGNVKNLSRVVNSSHNAKRTIKEKFIKPCKNRDGYLFVSLCKSNKKVNATIHRMVATSFLKNTDGKITVNHIDGNKLNNNVSNLEWNTYSENNKHAFTIGLRSLKGQSHNRSKLKNEDVLRIRSNEFNGLTHKEISIIFNVSRVLITNIKSRKHWNHL